MWVKHKDGSVSFVDDENDQNKGKAELMTVSDIAKIEKKAIPDFQIKIKFKNLPEIIVVRKNAKAMEYTVSKLDEEFIDKENQANLFYIVVVWLMRCQVTEMPKEMLKNILNIDEEKG